MIEPLCVISLPEKQIEVYPGSDDTQLKLLTFRNGEEPFAVEISKRLLANYLAL